MVGVTAEKLNDVVTHHMRSDFVSLRADRTVADALATIRETPVDGRVVYFYAADEQGRLTGVVPTRRLLLSRPEVRHCRHHGKKSRGHTRFGHGPRGVPILRVAPAAWISGGRCEQRILGVVDVDLYTGELSDLDHNGFDDLFQLIGVHASEAKHAEPAYAFRKRFPWLLCNIAGGIIAAWIGGFFKHELTILVELALFIPVVLNLAESVSTQSVSLALEALHGFQPTLRGIAPPITQRAHDRIFARYRGRRARRLAGAFGLRKAGAVLWVLMGGIAGGMTCSAVVGAAMPNLLRLMRFDPRRRRTNRAGRRRRRDDPALLQPGADSIEMNCR